MAANSFSLTKELALSSDILLTCWCPTMDLCAVVSSDGQLHLHRMDWQQLWAVSPEALVTALCWRPDGKQLAAGHANGGISILNVETGDVISDNKVHYASIATLQWSDQAEPAAAAVAAPAGLSNLGGKTAHHPAGQLLAPQHSMLPHQRFKRLFAPPELSPHPTSSTEPLPDPYDMCMEAAGVAAWPAERAGLSLLCAGDARGHISLWLQGQVQIAEVAGAVHSSEEGDDGDAAADGPWQLVHAVADSGLQQLITVNCSQAGGVVVSAHTLSLLQQHQQALQQCAALFSHIQSYLRAAQKSVDVCQQDWSSTQADFHKRFDTQLKQELSDQGSSIAVPQQELLLLLATGACTAPLHNFLSSTLGEAGLRRLARAIDAAASGLHTALLERLMPLAELVLFLIGELRGAVLAAAAQPWTGLQMDMLQQLELQGAAMLLRMEQLRRAVTSTACQYRAFCTWLLKTIQQLEASQEPGTSADASTPLPQCQEVLAFLKGQFMHDIIGPELSGCGLDAAGQARAEARFYQGVAPSETHQLLAMLLPCCPAAPSLQQQPQQHQQHQQEGVLAIPPVDPSLVHEAAAACSRPLAQQLQHLAGLCESAFELPVMHISPCITPIARLRLLPSAAAAGSGGGRGLVGAGAPDSLSSPVVSPAARAPSAQGAAGAAAAARSVALGPALLQPKPCIDLHTYVACMVPAAIAPATGLHQQQQLLVVRLQAQISDPACCGGSSGSNTALGAEAVLLQLPQGMAAEAWAVYKEQQVALLLYDPTVCKSPSVMSPSRFGGSTPSSSGSSSLHLVDLSSAPWAPAAAAGGSGSGGSALGAGGLEQQQQLGRADSSSVAAQCVAAGAVVDCIDLPTRTRALQHGHAAQLAVSRSRGLGSLVTDMQHLLLLDLEEDEDEAGGGDGGEEDEEEDHGMEDADADAEDMQQ